MPLHKSPAVVLKSRKWGEADKIVTLYTLCFGKIRGVARGARKLKSQMGAGLEPFVHGDLNLFEKQGDSVFRITQVDIRDSFQVLREDLGKMSSAGRLVNLVSALSMEGDAAPALFGLLVHGLHAIQLCHDPALVALLFQIRILGEMGFCPQSSQCSVCGRTDEREKNRFSPKAGGMICRSCASRHSGVCLPMSPGSWAFLARASQIEPEVLVRLHAAGQVRRELEIAIEAFVTMVAGVHLPPVNFLGSGSS